MSDSVRLTDRVAAYKEKREKGGGSSKPGEKVSLSRSRSLFHW
jgi:hypothetical protein